MHEMKAGEIREKFCWKKCVSRCNCTTYREPFLRRLLGVR
ncbi:hypothetical protein LINGRAHAP2_LOCUS14918 [Linum grandiflorum]